MELSFVAPLWEWDGKGAWCFVTLPPEDGEAVRMVGGLPRRGFGSLRVEVTIGKSRWKTSLFPDKKSKSYLLPVKKSVRAAEHMAVGDDITVHLRVIES